jgi:hypothetical protein
LDRGLFDSLIDTLKGFFFTLFDESITFLWRFLFGFRFL